MSRTENIYNTRYPDLTYEAWSVNSSKDIATASWSKIYSAYGDYKMSLSWDTHREEY